MFVIFTTSILGVDFLYLHLRRLEKDILLRTVFFLFALSSELKGLFKIH
jgi:hypothetical protein